MTDPLGVLWPLVDAAEPIIDHDIIGSWPDGVRAWLQETSILRRAEDASHVRCPECHGHVEEIIVRDGPGGRARYFVPCPEVFRAEVPPEARHRWAVHFDGLVAAVSAALSLSGRSKTLVPGRLWRLGRVMWRGVLRDVLMARGLDWPDGGAVRRGIRRARRPVVAVAARRPNVAQWGNRVPPVVVLARVAAFDEGRLTLDPLEIGAAMDAAEAPSAEEPATEQLKRMIRRQVKAEQATALTDDAYVLAYRRCGSVRDAAALLSRETGQQVSKDRVHRAIQRAGGIGAVLEDGDSGSGRRRTGSQRRARTGRKVHFSKPLEE